MLVLNGHYQGMHGVVTIGEQRRGEGRVVTVDDQHTDVPKVVVPAPELGRAGGPAAV